MAGEADAFLLLILAFIFPPAAAAFVAGCGADLCLNILLTMLGYFPGCIHAMWLVIKRAEANETYGYKNWRYAGMGEYVPTQQYGRPGAPSAAPYGQAPPPQPPPPPPGPYPASNVPPPSYQAPVDQTYIGSSGAQTTPQVSAEQKSSGRSTALSGGAT